MGETMTERTENPEKDEVTDEQLEAVAGGTAEVTEKTVVKKTTPSTGSVAGESNDDKHKDWINI